MATEIDLIARIEAVEAALKPIRIYDVFSDTYQPATQERVDHLASMNNALSLAFGDITRILEKVRNQAKTDVSA